MSLLNTQNPSLFLKSFTSLSLEIASATQLLPRPSPISKDMQMARGAIRRGPPTFPLMGYNLDEICVTFDYESRCTHTSDFMSARLIWLVFNWFHSCTGFLAMLYDSGALISGSTVLKLISGRDFEPLDIDFVVSSTRANILHFYLLGRCYILSKSFMSSYDDEGNASNLLPGTVVRHYTYGNRSIDVSIVPVRPDGFISASNLTLVSSQMPLLLTSSQIIIHRWL